MNILSKSKIVFANELGFFSDQEGQILHAYTVFGRRGGSKNNAKIVNSKTSKETRFFYASIYFCNALP